MMKKLICVLVINTFLIGCSNLPRTSSNELNKLANSIAPALSNTIIPTTLAANSKKTRSKKTKKETPSLLSGLTNLAGSSLKEKEKKIALNQADIENIAKVAKVAADTLAVIGGQLANYFTQQDKENAVKVLKDTEKTQPVAWCSDSADVSENVEEVKCSSSRKIIQTPGAVVKKEEKVCRSLKTEVVTESGEIKTETQNLCQAENGEWYDEKST
jgi:hypothetical protein